MVLSVCMSAEERLCVGPGRGRPSTSKEAHQKMNLEVLDQKLLVCRIIRKHRSYSIHPVLGILLWKPKAG